MTSIFSIAALVCILATAFMLFRGILVMTKGTARPSQNAMRMRLALQGLAVIFLALAYLVK